MNSSLCLAMIFISALSINCRSVSLSSANVTNLHTNDNVKKTFNAPTFDADCSDFNIEVGDNWELYDMGSSNTFKTYTDSFYDQNRLQYTSEVQHVVLKMRNNNVYTYLARITLNPICHERDSGFFGIGSKWDDWSFKGVNIATQLPSYANLIDYIPLSYTYSENKIIVDEMRFHYLEDTKVSFTHGVLNGMSLYTSLNQYYVFNSSYSYNEVNDYSKNKYAFYFAFMFDAGNHDIHYFPVSDYDSGISFFPKVEFTFHYYGYHYFHDVYNTVTLYPLAE